MVITAIFFIDQSVLGGWCGRDHSDCLHFFITNSFVFILGWVDLGANVNYFFQFNSALLQFIPHDGDVSLERQLSTCCPTGHHFHGYIRVLFIMNGCGFRWMMYLSNERPCAVRMHLSYLTSQLTNQQTKQASHQPANQPNNQPTSQPTNSPTKQMWNWRELCRASSRQGSSCNSWIRTENPVGKSMKASGYVIWYSSNVLFIHSMSMNVDHYLWSYLSCYFNGPEGYPSPSIYNVCVTWEPTNHVASLYSYVCL